MKAFINHKKKGRFPIKQISKRVSAALLAVLTVLSLLPQTALALDPDQRQAERREGYDVATVHYTDAKGDEQAIPFTETGSGYVYTLPQGVTEDKATVEYFSTTRWDGAVDISWYNDTDREFTLTNPAQLAGLAKLVKEKVTFEGKTIRLGADIYLLRYEETGKPWWDGIGITTSSTAVFKGTFDGCGHTIDQMLAGSSGSGAGLFLNTDGAAIQNLTVIGSTAASCCAAPTMAGSMPNSPGTPAASWAC